MNVRPSAHDGDVISGKLHMVRRKYARGGGGEWSPAISGCDFRDSFTPADLKITHRPRHQGEPSANGRGDRARHQDQGRKRGRQPRQDMAARLGEASTAATRCTRLTATRRRQRCRVRDVVSPVPDSPCPDFFVDRNRCRLIIDAPATVAKGYALTSILCPLYKPYF